MSANPIFSRADCTQGKTLPPPPPPEKLDFEMEDEVSDGFEEIRARWLPLIILLTRAYLGQQKVMIVIKIFEI